MNTPRTLHLASTSPRRREILAALEIDFNVASVDVDETPLDAESPTDMVVRLALAKYGSAFFDDAHLDLGAVTAVVIVVEAIVKHVDRSDFMSMLELLS